MPTHPTLLPLTQTPLPTATPNLSFAPPSLVHNSSCYKKISPKYNLIELLDSFCLYSEVLGIRHNNIKIEFTDPQTITIRGRSERSGIGLIEGTITRSATTKDSKLSSLYEIVEDKCIIYKETYTGTLQLL